MQQQPTRRAGIFGLGVVGRALARHLEEEGWEVLGFSRSSSAGSGVRFDAASEAECRGILQSLPGMEILFTSFPPQGAHPAFFEGTRELAPRRILLGSTSIYLREGVGEIITEESPLKRDHARFELERRFLASGGHVVRLSGIYGSDRNPIRWVRQGRVGYEERQVNLVHRDDIAKALTQMAGADQLLPVYNLSDGQPHTWRAIIDFLFERGWIAELPPARPPKRPHSFIDNGRFRKDFPDFQFRDFWRTLEEFE